MARGNRREMIFHDDDDRRFFLKAVGEACERTGWRVHAWVLMGNHYHLFIETPEPNLVAGMSWLQNTYTRRYNVRHRAWGRVFGDRYKAVVVEGVDRYHYQTLMDYIHLNPVRARLVQPRQGQSVVDYPWSSMAGGYALPPKRRAKWLAAEAGLKAFDLADTVAGRRRMVERLDERAVKEAMKKCGVPPLPEGADARCSHLRRGWYWGGQDFAALLQRWVASMLKGTKPPKSRGYEHAPQTKAHSLDEAERCLKAGLAAAGLRTDELSGLKGSDIRKVALAGLLWRRTVASQEWIAERLFMKSAANVSQQLRRQDRNKVQGLLPKALKVFLQERDVADG
ncbi:transposase [Prosthecobacter sp.]|uniref:transposase n=1 Tax=Prosthecobacter sp. TaxID=1965333 RepID=UPI002488C5A4|nr:transposase [Prosthecobacter sp.]MDI1310912.1 transposase [Prosthecobacter sp.]